MPVPPANRTSAVPAPAVTPEPGWLHPVVLAWTALALFCMFTAVVGDADPRRAATGLAGYAPIRNGTLHAASR